jgi:hypothetical protein
MRFAALTALPSAANPKANEFDQAIRTSIAKA